MRTWKGDAALGGVVLRCDPCKYRLFIRCPAEHLQCSLLALMEDWREHVVQGCIVRSTRTMYYVLYYILYAALVG